jgi:hypothetical protein
VEAWDVDLIEVPLGFPLRNTEVKKALDLARRRSKIVFAAASGVGFNSRRCFPASSPHVIAINAVDGRGKDCGICAAPVKRDYNFSAPGVSLGVQWRDTEKRVSGPSFAVPIATAAAAWFLDFARSNLELADHEDSEWLYSTDGMREMLRLMSTEIDGYRFIAPLELFGTKSTVESICDIIKMAVRKRKRPKPA